MGGIVVNDEGAPKGVGNLRVRGAAFQVPAKLLNVDAIPVGIVDRIGAGTIGCDAAAIGKMESPLLLPPIPGAHGVNIQLEECPVAVVVLEPAGRRSSALSI
jgi:hypothetical protein